MIAQRLGVSSFYSVERADKLTLEHINTFGRRSQALFSDSEYEESSEFVFIVNGVTDDISDAMKGELGLAKPDFTISNPPSYEASKKFAIDIDSQLDAVDSHRVSGIKCINSPEELPSMQNMLDEYTSVVLVLIPKSAQANNSPNPYGTYEVPSSNQYVYRRQGSENSIVNTASSFVVPGVTYSPSEANTSKLPRVVPMCYASMDSCVSSTNNCSGHGACYQKHAGSDGGSEAAKPCFACGCVTTRDSSNGSFTATHWGGGACSKIDVSTPFWLIGGFTVLLVFLVGWSIGMIFSIGEEKLPGVIGAGVSGAKTR